jgi:hypothetical protein
VCPGFHRLVRPFDCAQGRLWERTYPSDRQIWIGKHRHSQVSQKRRDLGHPAEGIVKDKSSFRGQSPPPLLNSIAALKCERENRCGAPWARDFVPLLTPDLRPGLHYVAPTELKLWRLYSTECPKKQFSRTHSSAAPPQTHLLHRTFSVLRFKRPASI